MVVYLGFGIVSCGSFHFPVLISLQKRKRVFIRPCEGEGSPEKETDKCTFHSVQFQAPRFSLHSEITSIKVVNSSSCEVEQYAEFGVSASTRTIVNVGKKEKFFAFFLNECGGWRACMFGGRSHKVLLGQNIRFE
ncbi:hypothetical protein DL95DRAFT_101358 [Leptodontidium sp. 2 PMI_412]|nr:hypothetical protein DL95DRAFT_101358 [Leptodontidium sp. 2 PMI_412]